MMLLKNFGIAFVLAILLFLLAGRYLQRERGQLYKDAEGLPFVAAATNLAKGTVLKFDDIGVIKIFRLRGGYTKHYIQEKDIGLILGRKLRFDLEPRQPILWPDLFEDATPYRDAVELEVVAAATNLAKGAVLKFEDIGLIRIYQHEGGYTKHHILKPDAKVILGLKLRYALEPRQPILWADLELIEDVPHTSPDSRPATQR